MSDSNEINKDDNMFYSPSKFLKIYTCICITALLIFTGIVFCHCLCNSGSKTNVRPEIELQATENTTSVQCTDYEITVAVNKESIETKAIQYPLFYVILLGLYVILLITVIFLLIYLALKDDGGIRFAKLNEMRNLRRSLIKNSEINLTENEVSEKIEFLDAEKYSNNTSDKTSAITNKIIPAKKIESHKNIKGDFLKNYLNTISEI